MLLMSRMQPAAALCVNIQSFLWALECGSLGFSGISHQPSISTRLEKVLLQFQAHLYWGTP